MKKQFKWLYVAALAIGVAAFTACDDDDNNNNGNGGELTGPDAIAAENLMAHWAFDDTPNDQKGRQGTAVGSVTYVKGQRGKAYQGAEASYIRFPYSANDNLSQVTAYTIAFWVRFVERAGADGIFSLSGGEVITTDGVASAPADHWAAGLQIYQDGAKDSLTLRTTGNRNEFGLLWDPAGKSPMNVGSSWYHFMVTYDNATSTKSHYVNGKKCAEVANIVQVQKNPETGLPAVEVPLGDLKMHLREVGKENVGVIGSWANRVLSYDLQDWQNTFRGQLDELRVYNRALTDTEVKALYEAEFMAVED
ncbi:MAG: LamG domain-containing protein [Prevotellaceae bacterium]|jgi:hypothetical protein|nr:LamG domain-containing protein [Prevotellaceae bacterium]